MDSREAKGIILGLLALGIAAVPLDAQAGSGKQDKQIRIFERVIDQMLVDSPNFLVKGGDISQGIYVDGHGAVFTFKTSLNSEEHGESWWIRRLLDGRKAVILDDKEGRDRRVAEGRGLYARGKDEILEMIRDFGEVLTTLDDAEWLEIRVRLRGADYFQENDLRKLTVKVQMRDIRALQGGNLSESRFNDRVEMRES